MIARLGVYKPKMVAAEEPEGGAPHSADTALIPAPPDLLPAGPIGAAVRRPFLQQAEEKKEIQGSTKSEVPEGGDIVPPQMPSMVVRFEDPISYAPARYDPSGAHPLPEAHPFARAGQTPAMEAPPIATRDIPMLEPVKASELHPTPRPIVNEAPEAAEKPKEEDRSSRRRRGKKEDKKRGKETPVPAPAPPKEDDAGWRLEDIIGQGNEKGK